MIMTDTKRPTLLISGIAEGLGVALAETFAQAGHDIIGLSRTDRTTADITARVADNGGTYTHLSCDIGRTEDVTSVLGPVADRIDHMIHNAHALLIKPIAETSEADYERIWRTTCFGAMTVTKAVLPHMVARNTGSIIFSGATAGLRGGARFSAFASAKFALRGFAQSLAREVGPEGIHVAHVVLDGLIDELQTEQRFGRKEAEQPSSRLHPGAIAETYLHLVRQDPSAWTQEIDMRPFSERF